MRVLFYFSLFLAFIFLLPEAESRDSGILFLRGRVEPYTNINSNNDGVWVSSNNYSNISIKLRKRGRGPASILGKEQTFIDKATLLKEDIDLIVVEAP